MRPRYFSARLAACRAAVLVLGFVPFWAPALAHAGTAAVTGRVTDPDGRAVPQAIVLAIGPLGATAETRTDGDGSYTIPHLPDGRYDLRVLVPGFDAPPTSIAITGPDTRDVPIRLHLSTVREAVVVTASHVAVARSSTPATVTVITADDLRARQIETLGDALRDVPGLVVTRSGGRGALTSLFPRGGSSNYTLVLVDGVRTNAFGGAFDFAHLSIANVERIEIVRGPQSARFGSEAIGAVVHVVTRRGGALKAEGTVEGGSLGTERTALGTSGSRGPWSWGIGFEHLGSDGNPGPTVGGVTVRNDDYHRTQAGGTLGYRGSGSLEAVLAASVGADERGFPGPWGADPIGAFPGVDEVSRGRNDNRRVGLQLSHAWSGLLRQRVEASYADLSGDFTSPFGPSSSGTRRVEIAVQEDLAVSPRAAISIGGALTREQGRSTYVTGGAGTPIPIRRRNVGLFAETRVMPAARWNVTAGVRLELIARDGVEPAPSAFAPRPAMPAQTVTSLNPKVGVSYRAWTGADGRALTRLRASAGTGIRPPDVFEIAFTDNAALRPERSRSVEVGVEQQLADGALTLDAAAFVNRYDDLIVAVGRALGAASRYRTDNISNARARGLELTARARLPFGFSTSGTYTRLATAVLSVDGIAGTAPPPFAVGDPLIRRPRHHAGLEVRYAARRASAYLALTTRGRVLDLEPNFGSFGGLFFTPGYTVVGVGGAVPIRKGLEIFARVDNATDRRYEETLGYPALGRTGLVGVRVAAGR